MQHCGACGNLVGSLRVAMVYIYTCVYTYENVLQIQSIMFVVPSAVVNGDVRTHLMNSLPAHMKM